MNSEPSILRAEEKSQYNQISLTGVRAIVMLGLLIQEPRSLEDFRRVMSTLEIFDAVPSEDILRIDLNTLKHVGCKISRADMKTGKYTLLEHPFSLELAKEEVNVLKRAYLKVKATADIQLLIKFDDLFKKLAKYICQKEIKEAVFGISALKDLNTEILKELVNDYNEKRIVTLVYKTPSAKTSTTKEIVIKEMVFKNDKIYIYGFDFLNKKSIVLNVKRILSVISHRESDEEIQVKTISVKFFLKSFGVVGFDEKCETILETTDDGYVVEGNYYNEFLAIQRILSYGSNCTVLEPEYLKDKIIDKLKCMRETYLG